MDQWCRRRCCFKIFLFLALVDILFSAISHCSHLLLKMKSCYNIMSLAKSTLLVVEKFHTDDTVSVKKCILITFGCSNNAFLIPCHFIILPIFNSLDATSRVSKSLDPDQAQHFVGPDLGPNCLQRLSADNKSSLVGKELDTEQLVVLLSS